MTRPHPNSGPTPVQRADEPRAATTRTTALGAGAAGPDPPGTAAAYPPSVDAVARHLSSQAGADLPQPLLVDAARAAIGEVRAGSLHPEQATRRASELLTAARRRLLIPVINATGVLLHTNLGRSPLAHDQPARFTNLELDLDSGRRGSRSERAGALLARACGSQAALVVNNGAAAVLLVLAALARGQGVAVSRGELVEIGGGFRIPEVMEQSGARLVEVGTTNRTRPADFARAAATEDLALVMKVHRSNYRIVGFTESVEVEDLVGHGVPVVADLGSGLLDASCPWLSGGPPSWLSGEPAVRQSLRSGADLVTFSGDKLLGGPQAGIIAGRSDLVTACASHPLARALRPGSLVLGALERTALAYLARDGQAIPFWRMAGTPVAELRERAERLRKRTGVGEVLEVASVPGGGTLPGVEIPSVGLAVDGDVTAALRAGDVPVIARCQEGHTVLDLRTVFEDQDEDLVAVLRQVCSGRNAAAAGNGGAAGPQALDATTSEPPGPAGRS